MTTEDDFQAALDAHPEDWQTRLVFADWLEEQGDPRAEGYRSLGRLRRPPVRTASARMWEWDMDSGHRLPDDWLSVRIRDERFPGDMAVDCGNCTWRTRRAAEDAAALAFAKLPADRRADLLALQPAA